tara:strand:+ start:1490 stop:2305 length:816 start_codon:yes stop_codon:yes gene_type:complete
MLEKTIPSSGEKIGVVGLGTWRGFDIGNTGGEQENCYRVLENLVEAGGQVIDSSPMYGRAEEVTGELLKQIGKPSKTFIATKVWTTGKKEGVAQMENSFRLFKRDVIDLMQIHNLVDWHKHLKTMKAWKKAGRFRYLGYTEYRPKAFKNLISCLSAETVDFVQFCYSIEQRQAEEVMLPFCHNHGIATLINLPFGGGSLLSRLSKKPLPAIAIDLGCISWAQFCLKYVISHPAVTCVIPGTSNPVHMAELVEAGSRNIPDQNTRREMANFF